MAWRRRTTRITRPPLARLSSVSLVSLASLRVVSRRFWTRRSRPTSPCPSILRATKCCPRPPVSPSTVKVQTDASDATNVLNNFHLNVETLGLADECCKSCARTRPSVDRLCPRRGRYPPNFETRTSLDPRCRYRTRRKSLISRAEARARNMSMTIRSGAPLRFEARLVWRRRCASSWRRWCTSEIIRVVGTPLDSVLEEGLATKVWVRSKLRRSHRLGRRRMTLDTFSAYASAEATTTLASSSKSANGVPHSLGMRSIKRLGSHNGIFHVGHISPRGPIPSSVAFTVGSVSSVAKRAKTPNTPTKLPTLPGRLDRSSPPRTTASSSSPILFARNTLSSPHRAPRSKTQTSLPTPPLRARFAEIDARTPLPRSSSPPFHRSRSTSRARTRLARTSPRARYLPRVRHAFARPRRRHHHRHRGTRRRTRTTRDRGPPPRPLIVVHGRTSEWANGRTHRVVPRSVEPPDDDEKDDETRRHTTPTPTTTVVVVVRLSLLSSSPAFDATLRSAERAFDSLINREKIG